MKLSELEFQIEWLKTYAFTHKLNMDFQLSNTPVSKEHFIDIDGTTLLGFTIEEARLIRDINNRNEMCLTRHMSINFQNDIPKGINFDFYLSKFEFDINIPIASYNQQSKYGGVLVHFIQQIE